MTTALEQLEAALPLLTDTLRQHWSTGQGKRVRAIVWSLYGGDHLVGLGYALSGLDGKLGHALGTAIRARIELGAAVEPLLKTVLKESGELRRYEEAREKIPDHLPTPYPPPDMTARELRELADALDILYPAN
jgi:hypothetical protein